MHAECTSLEKSRAMTRQAENERGRAKRSLQWMASESNAVAIQPACSQLQRSSRVVDEFDALRSSSALAPLGASMILALHCRCNEWLRQERERERGRARNVRSSWGDMALTRLHRSALDLLSSNSLRSNATSPPYTVFFSPEYLITFLLLNNPHAYLHQVIPIYSAISFSKSLVDHRWRQFWNKTVRIIHDFNW